MTATFDLVIRGGTVADGGGGELYEADVAVSGGRIAAVGKIAASGAGEIDARGRLVTLAYDLPAGGKRRLQRARGYEATVVSGAVVYRNGEPTGALPGRLVRGAQRVPAGAGA